MIIFWILLCVGLCLFPFYFLGLFVYQVIVDRTKQSSATLKEASKFEIIPYEKVQEYLINNTTNLEKQGQLLAESDIDSAYFLHGTFVGDDPFNILSLIELSFPKLPKSILKTIKSKVRSSSNLFANDLGNFSAKHFKLFSEVTQNKITIHEFSWSSANNHLARIKGAIELIQDIHKNHQKAEEKILLMGHSHAGQIFALLTKLINDRSFSLELEKLLSPLHLWPESLTTQLREISSLKFDFVTLGAPARYEWCLSDKMRLLHFINHRGVSSQGGEIKGFLKTESGDYIQQWGGAGSDMLSLSKFEQNLNRSLDNILGSGIDFEQIKKNFIIRNRLHNEGHHLLVDYNDQSVFPNCLKTVFGHGVYTKVTHLSFHLAMINHFFYRKD